MSIILSRMNAHVNVGGQTLYCEAEVVGYNDGVTYLKATKCKQSNGVSVLLSPLFRARVEALLFAIAEYRGLIEAHHA